MNADGTYTSDLPFAFCEGAALDSCEALKEAAAPSCPCVEVSTKNWLLRYVVLNSLRKR